jgi:hypothetical protein
MRAGLLFFVVIGLGALLPASATGPLINDRESYPQGPVIIGSNTAQGIGVEGLAGSVGGFGLVGIGINSAVTNPATAGVYAATTGPGSYALYANSTSTDTSGSATQSFGVYGVSHNSNGLYGITTRPDVAAVVATNPFGSVGVAFQTVASGNSVVALSRNLNGVVGQTTFNSGFGGSGQAGVLGQDLSTDSGIGNSGIVGTSSFGFGVSGTTVEGAAVAGFSTTSGVGLYGSSNNLAIYGTSPNNVAVEGTSQTSIGIVADTQATPDPTDSSGLNGPPALEVVTEGGSPAIKVSGTAGDVMSLDANGDMILSGNLTVDGNLAVAGTIGNCPSCPGPLVRPQRTVTNASVGTYTPQQAVRTIEDVGESQTLNGRGYVRLDPLFASATDPNSPYLVFITPQGESNGLYVTDKTRTGFAVRETLNGHSSISFDYRIAAKPFGSSDPRLPALASTRQVASTLRPLRTPARLLHFIAAPLGRNVRAPHYAAGFIPRMTAPRFIRAPKR